MPIILKISVVPLLIITCGLIGEAVHSFFIEGGGQIFFIRSIDIYP